MSTQPIFRCALRRSFLIVFTLLVSLSQAPATLGNAPASPTQAANYSVIAAPILSTPAPALFGDFWTSIRSIAGSRSRMLQFGIVGMALAIYIMLWRK